MPGVKKIVYKPKRAPSPHTHHYIRDTEAGVLNAQQVARAALSLRDSGPAAHRQLRERARRTVIDNYHLRTLALPTQLKLLKEATDRGAPYLWKKAQ
jgi:hypothetical protein